MDENNKDIFPQDNEEQADIENTEKANEILTRRIITKGKYKTVEDSLKKYYTDLYNNYFAVEETTEQTAA